MEDTFGKVVAIFICVVQMFLIPVYLYDKNMERVEQNYIISEITYYVDAFRNTGIIEKEQYNNMRDKIFSLSQGYNINITHCTHEDIVVSEEVDSNRISEQYFNSMHYGGSIENELYSNGVYYLKIYDYICVCVEDKNGYVVGCYGGSVKNEAY